MSMMSYLKEQQSFEAELIKENGSLIGSYQGPFELNA